MYPTQRGNAPAAVTLGRVVGNQSVVVDLHDQQHILVADAALNYAQAAESKISAIGKQRRATIQTDDMLRLAGRTNPTLML
jgi:hypothetical protein